MMRGACLVVFSLFAASCAQGSKADKSPEASIAQSRSAAPENPVQSSIDPAITGLWQPYDNESNATLGTMDIQRDRIVFGKGPSLRVVPLSSGLVRIEGGDGAKPVSGPDTLCGADPVLSISFVLKETAPKKVLRVSVHDVPTGPGPDPDFDLHRCQTFTYVRD